MARFSQIDDSNRHDHSLLNAGDACIYLYEYTSGKDFSFSATNNLINNLKKRPSLAGTAQYKHKAPAIVQCANEIRSGLKPEWVATATFVPVPGSKAADHPDYDDRIERVCKGIGAHVDVRKLVRQTHSTDAAHEAGGGERIKVSELAALYEIDEALTAPTPTHIAIVDDVLTAGTHFRAMETVLSTRFPGVPILGIFVARRVFAAAPADDGDF